MHKHMQKLPATMQVLPEDADAQQQVAESVKHADTATGPADQGSAQMEEANE